MDSRGEDIAWLKSTFHPIPKPALPDDCIEYTLYLIDSKLDQSNHSELRLRLRDVQKHANQLQKQWLKDYIWQRQSFHLELSTENGEVGAAVTQSIEDQSNKQAGLSFLRGRTEYGDSIEDEWVILWLLRELTRHFSNLWIKVTDSDGEFLLIEASGSLPTWLEPDVAENRVWINNGQLKIIKPAGGARSAKRTDETLSLEEAHRIILSDQKRLMHSVTMEEEAFYRLRNYPGQIKDNMHHAVVRVPRKIAYLLLQNPAYVAPAVEAFYLRDPISLKPLQAKDAASSLTFPPRDLVELSVKFPRVAYAQLKSQDFPILDIWKPTIPPASDVVAHSQAETGLKLTCGFEMLLSDSTYQDRPAVREMHLLLEDLDSGDASLPSNEELSKLEKHADDESWMDISFDDLQAELNRSKEGGESRSGKKAEFGDKAAQENLQRIVKQFEAFLNDDKTSDAELFEGDDSDTGDLDDIDSDDLEEDKEASFAEADFTKLMQEMVGLPPEVMEEMMKGDIDALRNGAMPDDLVVPGSSPRLSQHGGDLSSSEGEEEDDEGIQEIMRRMGAELKASGALDLSQPGPSNKAIASGSQGRISEALSSDDEDLLGNEINEQLAKNMLQSFRSQAGHPGPATNLMALMAEQQAASGSGDSDRKDKSIKGKAKPKRAVAELIEDVD